MANFFWVGGTGTWDSSTTTHWATTSNGAGGAGFPTTADTAIFDSNSGSGTVTWTTGVCATLTCTGGTGNYTGTITGTTAHSISGSFNLAGTFTSTGTITFTSTSSGNTITCGGNSLPGYTFNGVGGVWTMQDSHTFASGKTLNLTAGDLECNGQTVTVPILNSSNSNTRTLTITNSTININGTSGTVYTTNTITGLTLNGSGSTINITDTGSSVKTFASGATTLNIINVTAGASQGGVIFQGNTTFGVVTIGNTSAGAFAFQGINSFTSLTWTSAAVGSTLVFQKANTYTFTSGFTLSGTVSGNLAISSSTAATAATLTYTGAGTINGCDYLTIQDSTPTQTNTWAAGAHSTLTSNYGNWLFLIPLSVNVTPSATYTINGVKIV